MPFEYSLSMFVNQNIYIFTFSFSPLLFIYNIPSLPFPDSS